MAVQASDILELVSSRDYLEYKGCRIRGKYATCPLHHDKKPSLHFNDNGLWYCFVCGVGGNVINLVMLVENLSFKESLHYISATFSLNLTDKPYKKPDNSYLEALNQNYKALKDSFNQEFNQNCERYYDLVAQVPYLLDAKDYTYMLVYHELMDEIEQKLRELEDARFKLRRAATQSVNR